MRLLTQRLFRVYCARLAVTCALLVMTWTAGVAQAAAQIDNFEQPYPYVVIEQDVRKVLSEFGRNIGIATTVSDKVRGVVRGNTQTGETAASFLHWLAQTQGLVWYVDRKTLFVSAQDENKTVPLPASHLSMAQRRDVAAQWPIAGMGVHVEDDGPSKNVIVTGPPAFSKRIAAVIAAYRSPHVSRGGSATVTVYRGRGGSQNVAVPR